MAKAHLTMMTVACCVQFHIMASALSIDDHWQMKHNNLYESDNPFNFKKPDKEPIMSSVVNQQTPRPTDEQVPKSSMAYSFTSGQSRVNRRTGTLSFGIKLGGFALYNRRFDMALSYDEGNLIYGSWERRCRPTCSEVFGIGYGWHLNIPWYAQDTDGSRDVSIFMGDGSKHVLERASNNQSVLMYDKKRNVKIWQDEHDLNYWVKQNGDVYHLSFNNQKILKEIKTREGFKLTVDARGTSLGVSMNISNGTDTVFSMSNTDTSTHFYVNTGSDTLHWETERVHDNFSVAKLWCRSCPQPMEPWKFDSWQNLIKKITYPSGFVEHFDHVAIGKLDERKLVPFAIHSLIQDPGYNIAILNGKQRNPNMTLLLDYHPKMSSSSEDVMHNFMGDGIGELSERRYGRDALMDSGVTVPEYLYHTMETDGSRCVLHTFNKYHSEAMTEELDCTNNQMKYDKSRVMRKMKRLFPCTRRGFISMIEQCNRGRFVYDLPSLIQLTLRGKISGYESSMVERTHYDEFGNIDWHQSSSLEEHEMVYQPDYGDNGTFRHVIEKRKWGKVNGNLDVNMTKMFKTEYKLKNFTRFDAEGVYEMVVTEQEMCIRYDNGWQTMRKTEYDYYTDINDIISFGRLRCKIVSAPGSSSQITYYTYSKNAGHLNTTQLVTENSGDTCERLKEGKLPDRYETTSEVRNLAMNWITYTQTVDSTATAYVYDQLGRITRATSISQQINRNNINLTYQMQPNNNSLTMSFDRDRKNLIHFDNLGRLIQQSFWDGNSRQWVTTARRWYNRRGFIDSYCHVYRNNDGDEESLTTSIDYDVLGRITAIHKPNIKHLINYDTLANNGILEVHYLGYLNKTENHTRRDDGMCFAKNMLGLMMRQGIINNNSQKNPIKCSIHDSTYATYSFYNGYNQLTQTYTSSYNEASETVEKLFNTRYSYDTFGRLASKRVESKENPYAEVVRYAYDRLHGTVKEVSMTDEDGLPITIGSRQFDVYGRVVHEDYGVGVSARHTYNNFGLLTNSKRGSDVEVVFNYNSRGQLEERIATRKYVNLVMHQPPHRTASEWKHDKPGRAVETATSSSDGKSIAKKYTYNQWDGHLHTVQLTVPSLSNQKNKITVHMKQKFDDIGRMVEVESFDQMRITLTYSKITGLLRKILYQKKNQNKEHLPLYVMVAAVTITRNEWGWPVSEELNDYLTLTAYQTTTEYDEMHRVAKIEYKQRNMTFDLRFKFIDGVVYSYSNRLNKVHRRDTENTIQLYKYDEAGRIHSYECEQITPYMTKTTKFQCPAFIDWAYQPINDHYLKKQAFTYDRYGNIKQVVLTGGDSQNMHGSGQQKEIKMTVTRYFHENAPHWLKMMHYEIQPPNKQNEAQITYDKQGNIVEFWSTVTTGLFSHMSFDALNSLTRLSVNQPGTITNVSLDENGKVFYSSSSELNETVFLRNEIGQTLAKMQNDNEMMNYVLYGAQTQTRVQKDGNLQQYFGLDIQGSLLVKATQNLGFRQWWNLGNSTLVAPDGRVYAPWLFQFLQFDPQSPFESGAIHGFRLPSDRSSQNFADLHYLNDRGCSLSLLFYAHKMLQSVLEMLQNDKARSSNVLASLNTRHAGMLVGRLGPSLDANFIGVDEYHQNRRDAEGGWFHPVMEQRAARLQEAAKEAYELGVVGGKAFNSLRPIS